MPKLNCSGNLPNTIRNNILKLPLIPTGAFSIIRDGVQDGRQNVNTPQNIMTKGFSTVFYPTILPNWRAIKTLLLCHIFFLM